MCGYGNRVPKGWHRIGDWLVPKPPARKPARPFVPDYEGKDADEKILAEIAAKPEEMYGSY